MLNLRNCYNLYLVNISFKISARKSFADFLVFRRLFAEVHSMHFSSII